MTHQVQIEHATGTETISATGTRMSFYRVIDQFCDGMREDGKEPTRVTVTFASGRTFELDATTTGRSL